MHYITIMSRPISDEEEAVAAADKEMEERANRAKALLSQRYVGLKRQQVRCSLSATIKYNVDILLLIGKKH